MCNQLQALSILREAFISSNNVFNNKVSDAYLYGSFARGDYHEYSDVDILVIVDLKTDEISDYRRSLANINSELSLKYNVTVSVTVKPIEHFRKYANVLPYYKNVINEGIRYKFSIKETLNTPNADDALCVGEDYIEDSLHDCASKSFEKYASNICTT